MRVGIGDASVTEGNSATANKVTLAVSLSAPAPGPVTVVATLGGGTADGSDVLLHSPITVKFNTGQWQKTITLPVVADTVLEGDETFLVTLSSPSTGLSIDRSVGTLSIRNDD